MTRSDSLKRRPTAEWCPGSDEYAPPKAVPCPQVGFRSQIELLGKKVLRAKIPRLPGYSLEYSVGGAFRQNQQALPLRKVVLHVKSERGNLCGYLRAFIMGPVYPEFPWENLMEKSAHISPDLRDCMAAATQTSHSLELLETTLESQSWFHLDMFEISSSHLGRGLGAQAIKALLVELKPMFDTSLLTYRPFPFQFLELEPALCLHSHAPEAVEAYCQFIQETARLSRYYAKIWGGQRIPLSDYFVATASSRVSLAFDNSRGRWALLPA